MTMPPPPAPPRHPRIAARARRRRAWSPPRCAPRTAGTRARSRSSHPHHRRPRAGSPARRDRRQGAVDQGTRSRAAGRRDRFRGAFDEGCRDDPARTRSRIAAMLPRADVRDRLIGAESIAALPRAARGSAPPRRAAPRSFGICGPTRDRAVPRQCRHAAAQASRRARPMRPCSPPPASIGSARGEVGACDPDRRRCCRRRRRARSASRRAPTMPDAGAARRDRRSSRPTLCVLAERALLAALGADCHSPVAALARLEGTSSTCAPNSSARMARTARRSRRRSPPTGPPMQARSPIACSRRRRRSSRRSSPGDEPPLLVLRPEPGAVGDAGGGARGGVDAIARRRCSSFAPSPGARPLTLPAAVLMTSAARRAPWRCRARGLIATCRSMRSAR